MKLLAAVPAIDLKEKPTATTAWWSLFRALSESGHQVLVIPFIGRSLDSPWWQSYDSPSRNLSSIIYSTARNVGEASMVRNLYSRYHRSLNRVPKGILSRSWRKSIDRILRHENGVDAVVFFNVPLNLLSDLPNFIRRKFGIPTIYFDADLPVSLPSYGGFHMSYYLGANLSEFDGFLTTSEGVRDTLTQMGARNVKEIHWAVDPRLYTPFAADKNTDVFFYGSRTKFRGDWLEKMVTRPAVELTDRVFVISGRVNQHYERVANLGFLSFAAWKRQICASKICLNITRGPHAAVGGTSTTRIFELASMGACIVSNPHKGIDKWFLPGEEILVLKDNDQPSEIYRWLLGSPNRMTEMGVRARARVLREHTYAHRADELATYLSAFS